MSQKLYFKVSLMTQSLLSFLYAELAYSIVFNAIFGVFFVRKVMKLDKLSQNHDVSIPRRVWFKFTLILGIICLEVLHVILSFTSPSYWLNQYPNFSFIIFFYVVNYAMQSYIVLKILSKGSGKRYYPNFFFWLYCMIVSIIEIAVVETPDNEQNFTVVIPLIVGIINFFLFFISLIFDKKTPDNQFIEKLTSKDSGRTIQDGAHQWQRLTPSNRLFIEFNQNFQINQSTQGLYCIFKIAVYVDQNASIISKTDSDFYKLSVQMEKFFPNSPEVVLPEQNRKFSSMMKLGEEKLKIYETYLLDLTRTGDFIIPSLLDFLEIPISMRPKLTTRERLSTFFSNDSGISQAGEKNPSPFFKVSYQNGKYMLENPDFLELIINKSTSEILEFYTKLKEEKRITLDILPQYPKPEDIVSFFNLVVNRKYLWRSFSSWFRLDIKLLNKVYNYFDPWMLGFKQLEVDIVGHEIVFDADGKVHTCYLLSIKNKPGRRTTQSNHSEFRGMVIKKRYSEFCTLDKHIRRFMSKNKMNMDSLPSIPPKFSPFGSKTSPKSRQVRFGIYIKGLIQIEGINHCIKLLQFLEFDSQVELETSIVIEPENHPEGSQLSYFSDLNEK